MIVGEWFTKTVNDSKAYRCDYLEGGKKVIYSNTGDQVTTKEESYTIEEDYLDDAGTYEVLKLENGHYLLIGTGYNKKVCLIWPANEQVEESETEQVAETTVEAQ